MVRREHAYLLTPFDGFAGSADAARRARIERAHDELMSTGSSESAGRTAADVLAESPGFPPALVLAAQVDFVKGDDQTVVERLLPVGDGQANYTASQLLLGRAAERLGDVALAYAAFRAIATRSGLAFSRTGELHPKALTAVGQRLHEALDQKKTDEAAHQLSLLQTWAPNEEVTLEGERAVAVTQGDKKAELVAVRGLLARHPGDVPLLERRADLELDTGDPGAGLKIIEDLYDRHPHDGELASRLAAAKFRWRLSLLPADVREVVRRPELTKAELAILIYWLAPEVRYGRPAAGRIATDVLDHPHREEIVRVVNLGLMDVDPTLHRFGPGQTMRRGPALRTLNRLLVGFGPEVACVRAAAGAGSCAATVDCQLVDDEEECDSSDTLTGEEAVELIRRALHVLGGA
jgi:hypothetical protein